MKSRQPRRTPWIVVFCLALLIVSGINILTYLGMVKVFWNTRDHMDLWMHGLLTGLLAFFLNGALGGRTIPARRRASINLAAVIMLVVAGLDELAQRLSAYRTSSIDDYLADIVGVVVFIGIAGVLQRFRRQETGDRRQEAEGGK